jgi:hypothetical protein
MHRGLRLAAVAACALPIVLAGGCADDESTRSVVTVVSINNNMPLQSDIRDAGEDLLDPTDDSIMDDVVEVTMSNYPHDSALDLKPGYPFGDVIFTSYKVTFIAENGNGNAPAGFTGTMYLEVPNAQPKPDGYDPPTAYILLVPAGLKAAPPLSDLPDPVNQVYQINCEARVEFYGEETVSKDLVTATATVMVSFADYVDEDEG